MGTVYTVEEIKAGAYRYFDVGMYLHMDGARIANAAVSLGFEFQGFHKGCRC